MTTARGPASSPPSPRHSRGRGNPVPPFSVCRKDAPAVDAVSAESRIALKSLMSVARTLARRTTTGACGLLFILGGSGCESEAYDLNENLSYDSTIGYSGTFDVYEPKSDGGRANRPAVLAIHGGAWKGGDKAWGEQFAEELCPFGYVVVSINYRLAGRPNATWPAQIEDVQRALRYVRANAARLRIDPGRIASLGMSAGGHLATMV